MGPLVHDLGIGIFLSGVLAMIFTRLKVPAIAGFVLAGVLAGPLVLGLVTDVQNIETISQLGFVLLLFVIGLELKISKILASGKTIAISGVASMPLTILFGFIVAKGFAVIGLGALVPDSISALYVGAVIGAASTLLVVKLFVESFELDTVPGRLALGLLIFEDIWASIILLIQPNLNNPELAPIAASFAGIFALLVIALLLARFVVPLLFRWIAKLPELVVLGAISWCFAVVFIGASFDMIIELVTHQHLHVHFAVGPGMGALIAGATIANFPYATEIVTKVGMVKDFFITLFFVGLGMSMPAPEGMTVLIMAVAIVLLTLAARLIVLLPLLYYSGTDQRNATVTTIRMSQMSEFGLIIAFLGISLGHISQDLSSAIILAFVITAVITTPLFKSSYAIHGWLAPWLKKIGMKEPEKTEEEGAHRYRLALLGFHRIASSLLHDISRTDPELARHILVVDFNVGLHDSIRSLGAHVHYGDLSNEETLLHAGIDKADILISTVPDDLMRGVDNRGLVEIVRRNNPSATIIANAVTFEGCKEIYEAGADYVFMQRVESARGLNEALKAALRGSLPDFRAIRWLEDGKPESRDEILP
ncbi:MAG: cation:proton antiporter [Rhodobiaceae bacterium]|nr:cation:proton antiporter [Rhodobiaceae bacterium]